MLMGTEHFEGRFKWGSINVLWCSLHRRARLNVKILIRLMFLIGIIQSIRVPLTPIEGPVL